MTRPPEAHLPPAGDGRIYAPRLAAIGRRGTHDRCQHRRDGCRPDAGPVTGQVRCRAGHRPPGAGVPGLDRGRAGLPSVTSGPPGFLAWLGGLSSSAGTSPGRGLAGASALRCELPPGVSTRWRNRATRRRSHVANSPCRRKSLPHQDRRNSGFSKKVLDRHVTPGAYCSHGAARTKRPSRPGSPPTGRLFDN